MTKKRTPKFGNAHPLSAKYKYFWVKPTPFDFHHWIMCSVQFVTQYIMLWCLIYVQKNSSDGIYIFKYSSWNFQDQHRTKFRTKPAIEIFEKFFRKKFSGQILKFPGASTPNQKVGPLGVPFGPTAISESCFRNPPSVLAGQYIKQVGIWSKPVIKQDIFFTKFVNF